LVIVATAGDWGDDDDREFAEEIDLADPPSVIYDSLGDIDIIIDEEGDPPFKWDPKSRP